jgi:hypothetical protein
VENLEKVLERLATTERPRSLSTRARGQNARDVRLLGRPALRFKAGRMVRARCSRSWNNGTPAAPSYAGTPTVLVSFNGTNGAGVGLG